MGSGISSDKSNNVMDPKLRHQDRFGRLPIHWAAIEGNLEMLNTLIQTYKDGLVVKDYWGRLPIHYAARRRHTGCLMAIMEAYSDGAKVRDEYSGMLPIHYALEGNRIECVTLLLETNPECLFSGL